MWTAVIISNTTTTPLRNYVLEIDEAVSGVSAFTGEGARLPVAARGDSHHVDLTNDPLPPGKAVVLILRLRGLTGLFEAQEDGAFEFRSPAARAPLLTVFQFRLPERASVEELSPEPIETRNELMRLLITVPANAELPEFFAQQE